MYLVLKSSLRRHIALPQIWTLHVRFLSVTVAKTGHISVLDVSRNLSNEPNATENGSRPSSTPAKSSKNSGLTLASALYAVGIVADQNPLRHFRPTSSPIFYHQSRWGAIFLHPTFKLDRLGQSLQRKEATAVPMKACY